MIRKIQNWSAGIFITATYVLSVISILGIWQVFMGDVITKSFMTIGLLAIAAIIVIVAGHYLDKDNVDPNAPLPGAATFKSVRTITLFVLIGSAALLVLVGVLGIWDVIADKQVVYKSLSSLGVIAFSSLISVILCLEREKRNVTGQQPIGPGMIVLVLVVMWILIGSLSHW